MEAYKDVAKTYRMRAEKIRSIAEKTKPETKKQLLRMAEQFDGHAEMLSAQWRSTSLPTWVPEPGHIA
jgi:Mor family transcriptional regulator